MGRKGFISPILLTTIAVAIITFGFLFYKYKSTDSKTNITPDILKKYTEFGDVKLPKLITKSYYLEGKNGNYEVIKLESSTNYLSNQYVNLHILFDSTEYTLFEKENDLYKYNKNTNEVEKIVMPVPVNTTIDGSQINSNLTLITMNSPTLNYLYNLESNKFTDLTDYNKPCGLYCGGVKFLSFANNDMLFIAQGSGDACWGTDIITTLNIKTFKVTKVGDFDIGCRGEKDSFIGTYKDNIITAADTYTDDKVIYRSLNLINVTNNIKTVLLDYSSMPQNIKSIAVGKNDNILLFNSDEGDYLYNLIEHKLTKADNISSLLQPYPNLEEVLKMSLQETSLSEISSVTVEQSKDPTYGNRYEAFYLTDKNGNKTELISSQTVHILYNKFRHQGNLNDARGICDSSASLHFRDFKFENNKIYTTVEIVPVLDLVVDCSPYYNSSNTFFDIYIDLSSEKVFINNKTK